MLWVILNFIDVMKPGKMNLLVEWDSTPLTEKNSVFWKGEKKHGISKVIEILVIEPSDI